jgi:PAS domain S-box-containing protein
MQPLIERDSSVPLPESNNPVFSLEGGLRCDTRRARLAAPVQAGRENAMRERFEARATQGAIEIALVALETGSAKGALEALASAGLEVAARPIADALAFENLLARGRLDAVLAAVDHPAFGAREALARLSARGLETPLIAIASGYSPRLAAELIEAGAADVLAEVELARLAPVLARALRQAEVGRYHNRTLAQLRESEARFKAIAANLPGLVFQALREPSGTLRMTYASEGCEALFGLPAQAFIDNPALFVERIHPQDRPGYWRAHAKSLRAMRPFNWEGRILMPGGEEIKWINLRASVRRSASGETVMEGIMLNVTQRRQAEEELRCSRAELRELSAHLQQVKEEERAHLAREIHDELGSLLTAAKIELTALDRTLSAADTGQLAQLVSIEMLLDQAMEVSRRISRSLRPGVLDYGIVAAIEWQAKEFEKRSGIACNLRCDRDDLDLAPEVSTALFRIFQETLTNVARHARAPRVWVEISEHDGEVVLRVRDEGCGIRETDLAKPGSFGIRGMKERVRALGGTLRVRVPEAGGTEVEVVLPRASTARALAPLPLAFAESSTMTRPS